MNEIRIGMVGYKFMGKAHSHAYHDVGLFFPDVANPIRKAICGRDTGGVEKAARQFGWESAETDWRELVKRDDIDLIDVNAPTNAHKEISLAAIREGKHVFCEKPLAMNAAEAKEMLQAAQEAGVKHMVGFNYRFAPAVRLAKRIIEAGELGQIYHFRASFLQDWIIDPRFPLIWKLQKDIAGSGAHGDLGAHLIDMAHYLIGGIREVIGMSETFVKQRPLPSSLEIQDTGAVEMGLVEVDDASLFMARFDNGALGCFEASRLSPGHRSGFTFEVSGSLGSIRFDLERMNELKVYFTGDRADVQGFRSVLATDPAHPYADVWWPPGHTIGYEHTLVNEVAELLEAIGKDRLPAPDFADGLRCQQVLEAVERSLATRSWVRTEDI